MSEPPELRQPTPAPPARLRRAAQARPRPELPRRLEHPRRDRARGGARRPTTSCSRSAAGSGCCPSTSRRAARTSTWSRSTAALEPPLREALDAVRQRRRCTSPTRWTLDLAALAPAPTKLVANLPYGIAAGAILRTIEELDGDDALGGDGPARGRRALRRRTRARATTACRSVLAQLAVRGARAAAGVADRLLTRCRTSTRCCSCSCATRGGGASPQLRALVHDAFAHRRKALAGSLALAPGAAPGSASGRARRWSRSAIPPTCAPSGCRRPTSSRCTRRCRR